MTTNRWWLRIYIPTRSIPAPLILCQSLTSIHFWASWQAGSGWLGGSALSDSARGGVLGTSWPSAGLAIMQAGQKVCDDAVLCWYALVLPSPPLYHSVILLASAPRLLVQPGALRRRLVLPASLVQTVAGRRRNPLATRTLQHEPGDKNKRSSNATGRREGWRRWRANEVTWTRSQEFTRGGGGSDQTGKNRYSSKSSPTTNTKCIITDLDPLVLIVFIPPGFIPPLHF